MRSKFSRVCSLLVMMFFAGVAARAQTWSVSSNPAIAPDPATTGWYVDGGAIKLTLEHAMTLPDNSPMVILIYPHQAMHRFSSIRVPRALFNGNPGYVFSVVPMLDSYRVIVPVRAPNGRTYEPGDFVLITGVSFDLLGFNPLLLSGENLQVLICATQAVGGETTTFENQMPTVGKVSVLNTFRRSVFDSFGITDEDFDTVVQVPGGLDVSMARVKWNAAQQRGWRK